MKKSSCNEQECSAWPKNCDLRCERKPAVADAIKQNLENADAKWAELYAKYAKLITALEEIADYHGTTTEVWANEMKRIAVKALEPTKRGES